MTNASTGRPPLNYASGPTGRRTSLVRLGGALGTAACCIGIAIFLAGCAGFGAVFALSILPFLLGLAGFVISIVGGIMKDTQVEDPQVFAAIFIGVLGIVGGLLLMAVWLNWKVLA